MKIDNLGNRAFDMAGERYQGSSGYCNINIGNYGCNVWGSNSTMLDVLGNNVTIMPFQINGTAYPLPAEEAQMAKYLNDEYYETLSEDAKDQIDNHLWNVGPLAYVSGQTLETDVSQEKAYKWRGNVGLINASDYVKASTNASCTTVYSSMASSGYPCKNNNYMYQSSYHWWTMSPTSFGNPGNVWLIIYGYLAGDNTGNSYGVRPTLFLKSDISLSGTGTETKPYIVN